MILHCLPGNKIMAGFTNLKKTNVYLFHIFQYTVELKQFSTLIKLL